ncbi:superfamily II DNA/RNA helicase required for DNA uptake (late competence protein) [Desulfosporosinus orientis DSM 765]|uniref:Superfamily II DNA/RNA helicase required for DNA uptake (Late competence protein) n=1 Tax=Desulfosporosinus orientis (strain ATCC 19365 / DSM 765 / NCIMB 8382 / VKM B-1628 / Singapore I) TaxID=768706 RepID=G7WGE6_DESOD|nr:DEAD/DEAH box helicase family protein [Desulfosporosinus orientis]AET70878.1 superfamily II DNA/RNA helicase required for DNA uptake (late competence protein) [Desulfosporosinus orientis DSM 765]
MLFILTLNKDCEVGFIPFQAGVTLDSKVIHCLSEPLPLAVIQTVSETLPKKPPLHPWGQKKNPELTKKQILKALKRLLGDSKDFAWEDVSGERRFYPGVEGQAQKERVACFDFNQIVRGKQLSSGDLQRLARDLGVKGDIISQFAQQNVRGGWAEWVPSVKQVKGKWQCQRCGEKDLEEWPSIYGRALTCRGCISMGSSTSLDVLYRDKRRLLNRPAKVIFQPHWSLTEAQRKASDEVLEFVKHSRSEALLWAACGAGKTEVCFPAAAWALKQGKSVLFAAPRQDVIHDIEPRFRKDFPSYPIQILTGMITNKLQAGGLVLATTHQVLRFWRSFDVIFMDEIDAFPYHGSRTLEWGLKQALSEGGKLLYLTATPTPERLKAAENGEVLLIRLPSRHHRNPLPAPVWVRSGKFLEASAGSMDQWGKQLELLRAEGPVLVFVPKISWVAPWVKCLEQRHPRWCINGSYSADPERGKKIKELQQGSYDIFVSTTILERGITLPGIQVAVLGADHPVFDERALVQMAGRVGRTLESPGGKVLFIAQERTKAMKRAVEWIEEQNRQAFKLGLIDNGERR